MIPFGQERKLKMSLNEINLALKEARPLFGLEFSSPLLYKFMKIGKIQSFLRISDKIMVHWVFDVDSKDFWDQLHSIGVDDKNFLKLFSMNQEIKEQSNLPKREVLSLINRQTHDVFALTLEKEEKDVENTAYLTFRNDILKKEKTIKNDLIEALKVFENDLDPNFYQTFLVMASHCLQKTTEQEKIKFISKHFLSSGMATQVMKKVVEDNAVNTRTSDSDSFHSAIIM